MRTRTLNILLVLIVAALPAAASAGPGEPTSRWQQETYGQWSKNQVSQTELTNQWWTSDVFPDSDPTGGAQTVAAFDADNDGDIDLALGRWQRDVLYLNDGAGGFSIAEAGAFDDGDLYSYTMAAFDADSDGDVDLLTGHSGAVSSPHILFLNNGNAVFSRGEAGELDDTTMDSTALAAFDANGDGHTDVLVSAVNGSTLRPIDLYINDGAGRFARRDAGALDDTPHRANAFAAVDIDGDLDMDLVVGLSQEQDAVFVNDGTGRFSKVEAGDFDDDVHDTRAIAVFDANLDGYLDIAAGYYGDRDALFLNNGQGRFTHNEAGAFDDEARRTYTLAAFDADSDGDTDLAAGRGYGFRGPDSLYVNDGAGNFELEATDVFLSGSQETFIMSAFDADNDGDMELATGGYGQFRVYRNHWNDPTCAILGHVGLGASGGDQFHEPTYPASLLLPFDADGDGDPDLATASSSFRWPGQVYLSDGAGAFERIDAGMYSSDPWDVRDMVALDVENDGDLDLVAGLYQQGVANVLYLNDGSGRFHRGAAGPLTAVQGSTFAVATLDADRDGDNDIVTSSLEGNAVFQRLYLNDGHGMFTVGDGGALGAISYSAWDILAVDLDRDGDSDLVIATDGAGAILLNDGRGRFTQTDAGAFYNLRSSRVAAFDADGDNDLDLIVRTIVGELKLLLNNGATQFSLSQTSNLQGVAGVEGWALLDINRDGAVDIVAGRQNQTGALYLNNGSGVFSIGPSPLFADFATRIAALAALDIDQDGDEDLAAASSGAKAMYRNNGPGVLSLFDAGDFSDKNGTLSYAINHLDFDRDGDMDLVVGRQQQRNGAFRNDGAGRFNRIDAGDFDDLAGKTTDIAAFDADGDGDLDLAVTNGDWPYITCCFPGAPAEPTSRNALYLNNGSGVFQLADAGDLDDTTQNSQVLAAFDADGDGDIDLAVGNGQRTYSGGVDRNQFFLNDGNGRFTLTVNEPFTNFFNTTVMAAFDADGDGDKDLVSRTDHGSARLTLLFNNGLGQFVQGASGDLWRSEPLFTGTLVPIDVDGDGDMDLAVDNDRPVWGNPAQNSLYVNDGSGRFTRSNAGEFTSEMVWVHAMAPLDFDGDGDMDLATTNDYENVPTPNILYLNDGTGVFTRGRADAFGQAPDLLVALTAFDADGDGDTDLAAGSEVDSQIFINENRFENGSLTSTLITPAIADPRFGVSAWRSVQVDETIPPQSQLTYDVLNAGGSPIPGFSNLRPGAAGRIDLSGLNPGAYPAIRLRANLADLNTGPDFNDRTPQLCSWTVTFDMAQGHVRYFPYASHGAARAQ